MNYFAYDLETSGLNINIDEPVEIGLAIVDDEGNIDKIRSYYVASKVVMSRRALEVHGISEQIYSKGLSPLVLSRSIEKLFIDKKIEGIIAFNGFKFDIPMLNNLLKRNGINLDLFNYKIEDPALWYLADKIYKVKRPETNDENRNIANRYTPKGTKYNLDYVTGLYGVDLKNAHSAGGDLEATIELWKKLKGAKC